MRVLLVIAALFSAWTAASAARPGALPPVERPVPAPSVAPDDTIHTAVQAGEALVVSLPARHQGREAQYRVLRAPALSWLVDRSFYWRTLPAERGLLYVLFERTAAGAPPDTLVLAVELVGG